MAAQDDPPTERALNSPEAAATGPLPPRSRRAAHAGSETRADPAAVLVHHGRCPTAAPPLSARPAPATQNATQYLPHFRSA
jgi:hypothetical protein